MSKQKDSGIRRVSWTFLACFEFAATILIGVLLYLCGAIYCAARVFLNESRGLFVRGGHLWRIRVGLASPSVKAEQPSPTPPTEPATCGPVGRGRFESWLN